ncbi:MAG TPA: DUF3596 domain-containing protein, partial [bacterium]|nr:DUF3596 domain-containing protein [bacterium]
LKDTPENRKLVEAQALLIDREMRVGTFNYLHWFPYGNRAGYFNQQAVKVKPRTLAGYYDEWILRKTPPLVRKSLARDYRQLFTAHIIPRLGHLFLEHLSPKHIEEFRQYLLQDRRVAVKTARNIINAGLRALLRDAREIDGLMAADPCASLNWPRLKQERPDPFNEEERDKILEYFYRKKRWTWPFVYFLFWTGCRPSETTALTWGDVDLRTGRVEISKSRYMGEDAATKTFGSNRTISLFTIVVDMLQDLKPLRVTEGDHVFLNAIGKPIDAAHWQQRYWHTALRACDIRPRKFYSTRHTFISLALSYNFNIKRLAEMCGTSVAMIERNYGRWLAVGEQSETLGETFGGTKSKAVKYQRVTSKGVRAASPFRDDTRSSKKSPLSLEDCNEISPFSSTPADPRKPKKRRVEKGQK